MDGLGKCFFVLFIYFFNFLFAGGREWGRLKVGGCCQIIE